MKGLTFTLKSGMKAQWVFENRWGYSDTEPEDVRLGGVGGWQFLGGCQMKKEVSQTTRSLLKQMLVQNLQSEPVN